MSKHETFNLAEIGKRLRTLRAYQRKTQSHMAKELGISLSHYSKLEIGIGGMSHGLALALCRQFDLPEEWLLYGTGPQPDLSNIKPVLPKATRATAAALPSSTFTDDQLVEIMDLVLQDGFKELAQKIVEAMNISLPRAMAMLVKEKVRSTKQSAGN